MAFEEGSFHSYLATTAVTLGRGEGRNGIRIFAGDKVQYDGTTVRIAATKETFESSSFDQAIQNGLFQPLATSVIVEYPA